LTEHWDGSRWSIVSSPDPSRSLNSLTSVAAAESDNVWAVGVMQPPEAAQVAAGGYQQARDPVQIGTNGLILHWDGQTWRDSSFPKLGQHQILLGVTAYSVRDVWAVGVFVGESIDQGQVLHGLLEHWDGSSWRSTEDTHAQYLSSIATSAAGGLWSVGFTVSPNSGSSDQAVAETCL
jgi:hypothetical protein